MSTTVSTTSWPTICNEIEFILRQAGSTSRAAVYANAYYGNNTAVAGMTAVGGMQASNVRQPTLGAPGPTAAPTGGVQPLALQYHQ